MSGIHTCPYCFCADFTAEDRAHEAAERHRYRDARQGYAVALFYGERPRVLVEIVECWNQQGTIQTYHYRGHNLDSGAPFLVLTIGSIDFDPASKEPPRFVATHVKCETWRRLR